MKNLYKIINQFNCIFGHKPKIIPSSITYDHLYLQMDYPDLPVIESDATNYPDWNNNTISTDRNNYGMVSIWVEHDDHKPNERPKFRLWHDNIYNNPHTMPNYDYAKTFWKAIETYYGCKAEILCGDTEVYLSDKLMQKFIQLCKNTILQEKQYISIHSNLEDINRAATDITNTYHMLCMLEKEMEFRSKIQELTG